MQTVRMVQLCVLAAYALLQSGCAAKTPVTLKELSTRGVVGELGMPLGTVTQIRATIVAGRDTQAKADDGAYRLLVIEVNGHPLSKADQPLMAFTELSMVNGTLFNSELKLVFKKTGKRSFNDQDLAEVEKGYVGKEISLRVYESGEYSGIPNHLPEGLDWQDQSFGFISYLLVVAENK